MSTNFRSPISSGSTVGTIVTFSCGMALSCLAYVLYRLPRAEGRGGSRGRDEGSGPGPSPRPGAGGYVGEAESAQPRPTEWLQAQGIDRQYQNRSVNIPDRHPVLTYQMSRPPSEGVVAYTPGDPIRPPDIAGPVSPYDQTYGALMIRPDAVPPRYGGGYQSSNFVGPYPGREAGVPVPMGALKFYNEQYNRDQFKIPRPNGGPPLAGVYNGPPNPFYGSVNAYSPFPEIESPWERAGILTSLETKVNPSDRILTIFRRVIAPSNDLWEYQVQDKDGFIIKLRESYIEDGDTVKHIIGKEGLGPWRANIFIQNKYVWV